MDSTIYKRASPEDINLLVDFRIIFSDELVGRQSPEVENMLRESMHGYFKNELNKTYFSWYVTIDGQVAAVAGMGLRSQPGNVRNPSGLWAYIMSVYTIPEHRRKGLSSALIQKLMDTGREMGITAFELHATPTGEQVYKKLGFHRHSEPTYRKIITGREEVAAR